MATHHKLIVGNSVGIEIKKSLVPIVKTKLGIDNRQNTFLNDNDDKLEVIYRKVGKYGPVSSQNGVQIE